MPRYADTLPRVLSAMDSSPRPAATTDADVLRLALTGDRECWDVLVSRHRHRVLVSVLAQGLPLDRAEDIAQQAWVRLFEQARAGRLDHLDLPGLAIRQAAYLAADERRRDHRIPPELLGDGLDGDPEAALFARAELAAAERALNKCTPAAQRVFRQVYEHPDADHAAAAKVLGMSVQRVRQVLCEVRATLRSTLERK